MDKFLSDALRIGLDERALFGGHKIGGWLTVVTMMIDFNAKILIDNA